MENDGLPVGRGGKHAVGEIARVHVAVVGEVRTLRGAKADSIVGASINDG
jgi:hypothetical protein